MSSPTTDRKSAGQPQPAQPVSLLRSSFILGGAQFFTQLIGIIRTKIIALLIGPEGIGMQGTLLATMNMLSNFSGLGLRSSSITDIAQANNSADTEALGEVVITIRRMMLLTGLSGAILMAGLSTLFSFWSFHSGDHVADFLILAPALLFSSINLGQQALLQGLRQIAQLGMRSILSAIFCTVISVFVYWVWGIRGISWVLMLNTLSDCIITGFLTRKITFPGQIVSWRRSFALSGNMFKLGIALMLSLLFASIGIYLSKIFIGNIYDLTILGYYQAAYTISYMIFGLAISSIAGDYYPQLAVCAGKPKEASVLMNHQIEIGLLLAFPVLLGMILMAWLLVPVLYTRNFEPAVSLLQIFCFCCVIKVMVQPIYYLQVARRASVTCIMSEGLSLLIYVPLLYLGVKLWAAQGAVAALLLREVFQLLLYGSLARKVFTPTRMTLLLGPVVLVCLGIGMLLACCSNVWIWGLSAGILEAACIYFCLRRLERFGLPVCRKIHSLVPLVRRFMLLGASR